MVCNCIDSMKRPNHHHKANGSGARSQPIRNARPDDGNAFLPDPGGNQSIDDNERRKLLGNDAEEMAEEFLVSATSAESIHSDANDEVIDDEEGGPFIILDPSAQLPEEQFMHASKREGHEPVQREHIDRGARWAARGR
jgi:hypothetical protein